MNAKTTFAGNITSQYDPALIAKEVHDFAGQAIRVLDTRSIISSYFTHFRATYNGSSPTNVKYYRGTKAYKTSIQCTDASTLNSKYFIAHAAPDNQLCVIWFNVDAAGVAPVIANSRLIEISLNSSDSATIVAAVIDITLRNIHSNLFIIGARNGSTLELLTAGLGEVDASFDVNTGFTVTGVDGAQELVEEITISYIGTDPVYNGQVLKNYSFDLYSGKFVKNPEVNVAVGNVGIADTDGDELEVNTDGSINVNVVSTGQVLKSYFHEVDNVATGVTTLVATYTAAANVYLQKIELGGTNIAEFELTIDGVTQDKKRTSLYNFENMFNFNNGLNISAGQIIRVYVVHTRPELGEFVARIQILEG